MDRDTPDFIPHAAIQTREPESSSSNENRCHGRHMIWSLQLLVSLSLFSLFVSYMTGISFIYSYTYYYFSTFLLPAVTHALERKYMFLLCNSLVLVFILGFHGSIHHDHTGFDEILVSKDDEELYAVPRPEAVDSEEEAKPNKDVGIAETETEVLEELEEEEDLEEDDEVKEEEEEEEAEEGKKDEDDGGEGGLREEVDKEVVTVGCATDEELNKKFDEFIRKMKEELRLEAQEYQLIAA